MNVSMVISRTGTRHRQGRNKEERSETGRHSAKVVCCKGTATQMMGTDARPKHNQRSDKKLNRV